MTRSPAASWPASVAPFEPAPALPEGTVRLAANESPLGPFPSALRAIAGRPELLGRYPELDGELIARLEALHGLRPGMVMLGNGADAIIGYLCAAYLRTGDEVVTGWPSFPTYLIDADKQEAVVTRVPLRDGAFDLEAMASAVADAGDCVRMVWVCTPNNPTGTGVTGPDLRRFLDAVDERVLVVVDEAYFEFCAPGTAPDTIAEHVRERPNVAVLRTFSKLYGLAGLRIGWMAAPEPIVAAVGGARHYYDVTGVAAAAALASLEDPDEATRRRSENARLRGRLQDGLQALGYRCLPSQANFVAVDVGDADAVSARLLAGGIATRSLSGLGCPELLRVSVGDEAAVAAVLERLGPAQRGAMGEPGRRISAISSP
jgi:histidinol-phosphate aminotransferase